MDLRKIKKLIELLEESGIAEIEVKEGEESIKLSRAKQIQQPMTSFQNYDAPAQINQPIAKPAKVEETQKEPVKNVMRLKKDATPPKITTADNFS